MTIITIITIDYIMTIITIDYNNSNDYNDYNNDEYCRMKEAEKKKDQPIDDSAVVEDIFGFLDVQKDSGSEALAPSAFRDLLLDPKGVQNGEVIMGVPTTQEDYEDLSEFKFVKFAATYFQGNVTHQYSRKPLKYSLLTLQTQGDQLVSLQFGPCISKRENVGLNILWGIQFTKRTKLGSKV